MSRLPILMYHNVSERKEDSKGLTISTEKLEEQFQYLKSKGYTSFHLSELENLKKIPSKSIVLTFDDVTENQFLNALPLLKKYNLKAVFYIPFFYIGKTDLWNNGTEKIMSLDQIKSTDLELVEFGFHSFKHRDYNSLSNDEIKADFDACKQIISENNLKVYPSVAYPYGSYPRKGAENANFKLQLERNEIKFGLRIGNRLNSFPFKKNHEIQRIDIKGEDGLLKFRYKINYNHIIKL
jgi:peptidoglycan/xylan/chitin deacetylase (PgdA/CDA1 family)